MGKYRSYRVPVREPSALFDGCLWTSEGAEDCGEERVNPFISKPASSFFVIAG